MWAPEQEHWTLVRRRARMILADQRREVLTGRGITLGSDLGNYIDTSIRWARLTGIRYDSCRELERFLIRLYQPGDTSWPTGPSTSTALAFVLPWEPLV